MDRRKLKLQQAIYDLEKPYPPDDLITCYKHFLQHREMLHYYQFNVNMLGNLIALIHELWHTDNRISRQSLIQKARRYSKLSKRNISYSDETRDKLFDLFTWILIDQKISGSKRSLDSLRFGVNRLLKNVPLGDSQLISLCNNINKSSLVLDRVLRYPAKSMVLSQWVKDNYNNDEYRNRRAELIGWIMDEDPNFVVDKQTLIDDFNYCNKVDQQIIAEYFDEIDAEFIVCRDLGGKVDGIERLFLNLRNQQIVTGSKVPKPVLSRRFYPTGIPVIQTEVPDFQPLIDDFYLNLNKCRSVTMLWATYYSRLSVRQKENLLIRHYVSSTYTTFFKIAKKMKNANLLKWLQENIE